MPSTPSHVIYARVSSVIREWAATLTRLSRIPSIAEDRAFSIGLLDRELRLIVQEQGEPTDLYAVRETARVLLEYFAYDVAEGDIFVVADPFFGGTHGHVLSLLRPIFWRGQLEFMAVFRTPVIDLAGELPGALQPFAYEVWQEAYRITPMRLYRAGALQKDVARFLSVNTRAPQSLNAEIDAVLAVSRTAEHDIQGLIQEFGLEALEQAAQSAFAYTEKRLHDHWRRSLPHEGQAARSIRDPAGEVLTIEVSVKRHAAGLHLDFTGSSPLMRSSLNATPQLTRAAAALPLLAAVLDDLVINEGVLNSLEMILPVNSVVHAAAPAATSLSVIITAHIVAAAVSGAARNAGAGPEDVPDVHGIAPSAVLYPPVGSVATTTPLYLSPGFVLGPSRIGCAALAGPRVMVSAEELEARHACVIGSRELTDSGDMVVDLIYRGPDCEATLVALGPLQSADRPPRIRCDGASRTDLGGAAAVTPIKRGAQLSFFYPCTRGVA